MRKDLFELLYNSSRVLRVMLKLYLKIKQFVGGKVIDQMEKKITVDCDDDLTIRDRANQPYAAFEITVNNQNFSPLVVDGYDVTVSFGSGDSAGLPAFKHLGWCKECVSTPPSYAKIEGIEGHGEGKIKLATMLPYYLYFPKREDTTLVVSGTISFETDAGRLEYGFKSFTHVLREDLENRTTAQDRLRESFNPPVEPVK